MKHLIKLCFLFIGALFLTVVSCEEEKFQLDDPLDASDLNFTVVQDYSVDPGGNTVILTNNTPQTIPIWDYEIGQSNRAIDTVRFAFAGEYTIQFSVESGGGLVSAPPVTISVTENNLTYVDHPLYTALTGGPGNSKTWFLDLDSEGISRAHSSPLYFYGTDNGWLEGGGPYDSGDTGCYGDDCWHWPPNWADNTWIMDAADYGEMTFSLEGGPFVSVENLTLPSIGEQNGTFFLDVDTYQLTMNNAGITHNSGYDDCVSNWGNITVFSLTEDTMQLGLIREQIGACASEGLAMIVYNFISEEYRDNWVPLDPPPPTPDEGFDPTFEPGELLEMLTGGVGTARFWEIDGGNPVDWITAAGNGWTTDATSSYNWGWNDEWIAIAADSWIRFDQFGGTLNYTRYQDGEETEGTFSIDESTNEITLVDNTLIQNPNSWMNPTTNTIKVVKGFNDTFVENGIWFGTSYNPDNGEWLVFHYAINPDGGSIGGGTGDDGTVVDFDNTKLLFGNLEDNNNNYRIEIYNDFGATAADPGLNTADLVFDESLEVTFTISGLTFNAGAPGSYQAGLQFSDPDWYPSYWSDGTGPGDTTITGDGTYTVSFTTPDLVEGCNVFTIDILEVISDIADLNSITVTIDEIIIN